MLTKTLEIEVSPEELAVEFCNYNDLAQVLFFNKVAEIMVSWEKHYSFQLQWITENKELTKEARDLLEDLGTYAKDNRE